MVKSVGRLLTCQAGEQMVIYSLLILGGSLPR